MNRVEKLFGRDVLSIVIFPIISPPLSVRFQDLETVIIDDGRRISLLYHRLIMFPVELSN